ncbi:MAG: hypothetical protein MMC23_009947 [Stictis urceolatum]|nr:hypothetical protein [Stictis urceolata]
MSQQYRVPSTPRVISPSPTSSDSVDGPGGYFAPRTRSSAKRAASSKAIPEEEDTDSNTEVRSRARSRSPNKRRRRRASGTPGLKAKTGTIQKAEPPLPSGAPNGHLSPASAGSAATSYWRELSRSPSPRLIPIHRSWRSFIHRHEIPRKVLHVSIGFFTLHFYASGLQPATIHPWLLAGLIPIASVDILRHSIAAFNSVYVRALGAFMRESEVNDKYNGVIFYLLGAWISLRFFPKDVGVMSILLLSWCDTAASTFGRVYGRYTPQVRKGKSLAGSAAAALIGTLTSLVFWGFLVPTRFGFEQSFMFQGSLRLPDYLSDLLGYTAATTPTITGWAALGVISLWSGFVASMSEVVNLFGLDDNLTIPVLSGIGMWGFLKLLG